MRGAQDLDGFRARREEVADVWTADQPETLDPVGMDGRKDHPDAAAERLPRDDRSIDADGLEEEEEILRVLFRRVIAVRLAAVPVPALIQRVDVKSVAERIRGGLPHLPVARRGMEQHQAGPRAGPLGIVNREAIRERDVLVLECAHGLRHDFLPRA